LIRTVDHERTQDCCAGEPRCAISARKQDIGKTLSLGIYNAHPDSDSVMSE